MKGNRVQIVSLIVFFNSFTPEFLKRAHPFLNLNTSIVANRVLVKNNIIANSVDLDEMAHYEPSHLNLHCLQRVVFWPAGLKGLTFTALWADSADDKSMSLFSFISDHTMDAVI